MDKSIWRILAGVAILSFALWTHFAKSHAPHFDLSRFPDQGGKEMPTVLLEIVDYMSPESREVDAQIEQVWPTISPQSHRVVIIVPGKTGLGAPLAAGAYCALQQGNPAFWKYHEYAMRVGPRVMNHNHPTAPTVIEQLTSLAEVAKLDQGRFLKCLESKEGEQETLLAVETLTKAGMTPFPIVYLNNVALHSDKTALGQMIKDAIK